MTHIGTAEGEQTVVSLPFQSRFFYGWVIVFVAALSMYFSGPGQTYSVSEFIQSYIQQLGLNRTVVSGLYSLATLCAGILLFLVGKLVDKYGARAMAVTVASLLGLACLWNSFVTGPVMLFIGFLALRLFGQGSMTLIPSTLVPQWFIRHRGRALSFMAIGGLAGGTTLPIVNNWMIATWSWHIAWRVWAGLLMLLFAPVAFYLIRNRPEDAGLLPDNATVEDRKLLAGSDTAGSDTDRQSNSSAAPVGNQGAVPAQAAEVSWTLSEAAHTKVFWFIIFCAFVPPMVSTGLTFNLFSILQQHGMDRTQVAFMLSFVPVIGFVIALGSGFLLERIRAHYVISFALLLNFTELVVLYDARSVFMVGIFILLWGISQGLLNIALKIIWPNYFGRTHLGAINSLNMMSTVIGSAFGPVPFGWAYDHFGGYQQILLVTMLFPLAATLFAFFSRPPQKSSEA